MPAKFSSQHYKVIARAINDSRMIGESSDPRYNSIDARWLVKILCTIFILDNSRFNADTFRKNCGDNLD